jgi:hypothetical protein
MESKRVDDLDAPYYALLMCAMRQADGVNAAKLRAAWPELWEEVQARYNAPAGLLQHEPEPAEWALRKYGLLRDPP